jgi:hypothetical protein
MDLQVHGKQVDSGYKRMVTQTRLTAFANKLLAYLPAQRSFGRSMRSGLLLTVVFLASLGACSQSPPDRVGKVDPNDPEFRRRVDARLEEMKKEEAVLEDAPWFGKTGLSEDQERELPRYLRREFGSLLSEPGSLRAQDLDYLGRFVQDTETVHYWRINHGSREPRFAYLVTAPAGREVMGWGDRKPPK